MMNKIFLIYAISLIQFNCCISQTLHSDYVYFKSKIYNLNDSIDIKRLMNRVSKIINNDNYYSILIIVNKSNQTYSNSFEKIKNHFDLIPEEVNRNTYIKKIPYFTGKRILFFWKKNILKMKITRLKGNARIYPKNLEKYFNE